MGRILGISLLAWVLMGVGPGKVDSPTNDTNYQKGLRFILHKRIEKYEGRMLMRPAPDVTVDADRQYAASNNVSYDVERSVEVEKLKAMLPDLKKIVLRYPANSIVTPVTAPANDIDQAQAAMSGVNPAAKNDPATYQYILNITGVGPNDQRLFTLVVLSHTTTLKDAKSPKDIYLSLYSDTGYRHDPELGVRVLMAVKDLQAHQSLISDELATYLTANIINKKKAPCVGGTYYKAMNYKEDAWRTPFWAYYSWTIPKNVTMAPSPKKYLTLPWTNPNSFALQACFRSLWPRSVCIDMQKNPNYQGKPFKLIGVYEVTANYKPRPPTLAGSLDARNGWAPTGTMPAYVVKDNRGTCRTDSTDPYQIETYSDSVFLDADGTPTRKFRNAADEQSFTSY